MFAIVKSIDFLLVTFNNNKNAEVFCLKFIYLCCIIAKNLVYRPFCHLLQVFTLILL